MSDHLAFLLLGLGAGALYGALALGVVLAHRGSGVVNFSHGAVTMYVAYVYSELRRSGELVVLPLPNPLALVEGVGNRFFGTDLDLPDIPTFIGLGDPMGFVPAVLISLLMAVLIGLAMHFLVFRRLRDAPPLAKVVAAVGIMIVLQASASLRFGSDSRSVRSLLPTSGVELFGRVIPWDRFILAGLTLALALVLTALYRWTSFGLATRAASENEKGASLLGYSPDMLAGLNWVFAMVLAGIVGILASPITSLNPVNYTLFVIPALAAALVARMSSFVVAAVAGIGLGMADQLVQFMGTQSATDWLPRGSREMVPFLVILVVIVFRGDTLPTRGSLRPGRLPSVPLPHHAGRAVAGLFAVSGALLLTLDFEWRQALATTLIGVILALSLVVLTGFVGQISLAQMAIAGFSAYLLTLLSDIVGVPFPFAPVIGALGAALLGVFVGLPALRVRGVNLAIITLSLALVLQAIVFNNSKITQSEGRPLQADPPALFGIGFGPFDSFFVGDDDIPSPAFGFFVLVIVCAMCLAIVNLRRSTTGRRMLAVRSNEAAAAAAGVDVVRVKLASFAIASFVAGLGGALLAYQAGGRLSPQGFAALQSLNLLAVAYLGGITSLGGAVLAGVTILGGVVTVVGEKVVHIEPWQELMSGLGLILVAILHPSGMAGAAREKLQSMRRRSDAPPARTGPVAVAASIHPTTEGAA